LPLNFKGLNIQCVILNQDRVIVTVLDRRQTLYTMDDSIVFLFSMKLTDLTVLYLSATTETVCSSCDRYRDWQCCWLTATDSVYETNVAASSANSCCDVSKLCPMWHRHVAISLSPLEPFNYTYTSYAAFRCWPPIDVELHTTRSQTCGLKVQVGIVWGILPGFVTGILRDSVRRWNLWFPSAELFAEVLVAKATWTHITFLPIYAYSSLVQNVTGSGYVHDNVVLYVIPSIRYK